MKSLTAHVWEIPQTCPARMLEIGPWERKENLDGWVKVGQDLVCSFCGSLHPDDFERILDRALEEKDVTVDPSTKGGKWYVWRPEVKNASEGGIKYKSYHNPKDQEWIGRVNDKLVRAITQSRDKWMAKFESSSSD